ncbi:hypothetical protein BDY17DRAFT_136075 [Neohortaea acidophila]|uniref:Secreted protein n=1 Tax=Neohortaea acidophila TaxID=245834 RepID=A0A6A6PXP5_9PEZI|nr:uncharacterized protein BDY17DRAFT_136075 [Neohortaea acidophila]KAF2484812.1 hypothetical protein BDY17DRAFT_136075 [Neohortaea acidophila]
MARHCRHAPAALFCCALPAACSRHPMPSCSPRCSSSSNAIASAAVGRCGGRGSAAFFVTCSGGRRRGRGGRKGECGEGGGESETSRGLAEVRPHE